MSSNALRFILTAGLRLFLVQTCVDWNSFFSPLYFYFRFFPGTFCLHFFGVYRTSLEHPHARQTSRAFFPSSEWCHPDSIVHLSDKTWIGCGPRPQDSSDHQDYEPFLVGDPTKKPSFATGILWGGHIQWMDRYSAWWLNQPIWKILVKLDHFHR